MVATPVQIEQNLNDSVTEHMRTDFARLHVEQTVGQALESIRKKPPEGRIIYFYVVDSEERLKGVVPTRRLLLSGLDVNVADIMVKEVVAMPQEATVLDACEFFTLHRLLAFPVVDDKRRLLGVVDVELYTNELNDLERSERSDDLFQLIGIHRIEAQQSSPATAFRERFPWLLCNIAGGIVAAFLSGLFESELQKAVALALFIPVVLALAESVSIQSVSLALLVLHRQKPTLRSIVPKLQSEAVTGLLQGGASALAVGTVAFLWLRQWTVAASLFAGVAVGVAAAAVLGVAMPNLLRLFRRDPRVAAGPIALAAADLVTLLVYFNVARWLLR